MPVSDILQLGGAAPAANALNEVVPTVYIGLGGSGKAVLMKLRKRFFDRYTLSSTPFTRFMVVDADQQPFDPKEGESADDYAPVQLGTDEMVNCQIDEHSFYETFSRMELTHDPRFLPWLKPELKNKDTQTIVSGCGTYRPLGRMAFFLKYQAISGQLQFHLKSAVEAQSVPANLGPGVRVDPARLEVVIITSLAGGTGSGMFIDMAYLVRKMFNEVIELRNRTKSITLIAFLPWMFKGQGQGHFERHKQNTYAALMEMEKYGTSRSGDEMFLGRSQDNGQAVGKGYGVSFDVHWHGQKDERIERRGWDTCYLLDNVNNFTLANPLSAGEMYQMAADYLWLDFGSNPFSISKRSARSNLVQFLDRIKVRRVERLGDAAARSQAAPTLKPGSSVLFEGHNGCTFSSFGLAEVAIDTERVQRAAAYRLAERLVKDHWLREPSQVDRAGKAAYAEWSKQDLMIGRPLPTGGLAPSFHPDEIAKVLLKHQNIDWMQRVEQQLSQAGAGDPGALWGALNQVVQDQQRLLAPARPGGEAGQAWQAMQENFNRLANEPGKPGPLRERLRLLAEDRVASHGVRITLKLFEVYNKSFDQVVVAAQKSRQAGGAGKLARPTALARLEEARSLPGFVRATAVRIEQARAQRELDQARRAAADHSQKAFQAAAGEFVEQIAQRMKQHLGIGGGALDQTLHSYYRQVEDFLEGLGTALHVRFDQINKSTASERRVMLLPKWSPEDFDHQLNRVLVERQDIGPQPPAHGGPDLGPLEPYKIDWEKLSRLVIDEIKSIRGAEMASIDNLSHLLTYWMRHQENVNEGISRVAELVHDACYRVLRAHGESGVKLDQFAKGSIVDLLMKNQEYAAHRRDYISKLVHSSACYLPTVNQQRLNSECAPEFRNIYGQAGSSEPSGEQNAAALKAEVQAAARAQGPGNQYAIGEPQAGAVASLVLSREMAGFPLYEYARLQELHQAYKDQREAPRDECHLSFRETLDDLPEIREVSNEDYKQISEHIEEVLQALIQGIIVLENDAYCVRVPTDISMAEYRLGKRLDRIIKHACEKPEVRGYLAQRVKSWRDSADTGRWAVLYSALLQTFFDTRGNKYVADMADTAPPLQNCVRNLIHQATEKLQAEPGGKVIFERLKPVLDDGPDAENRRRRQEQALADVVSRCLQRIGPSLPIYRIVGSDLSFLTAEEQPAPA